jgi:hypothetical protein
MAEPTKKSEAIEDVLTDLAGADRRETIKQDVCIPPPIGCGGPANEFEDEMSRREFRISGLCQACQNKVFGSFEEMEED